MTKSKNSTNLGRRTFLSTAACAAAAVAGSLTGSSVVAGSDPIFAAIEAHKAAKTAFIAVVSELSFLEQTVPDDLRQSYIDPEETLIVPTDDPRWIKSTRDYERLDAAEIDAAVALVNIAPTTMAGVIALLRYADAADTDGHCWPIDLRDDGNTKTRSWQHFLIEATAEALSRMVSA